MKTIIVCTDFSQEAENATHYAASMAKENQYRIVFFNLQSISIHALNAQASADFFYEQTLRNQKKLSGKAAEIGTLYTIETAYHLASGSFIEELNKCIQIVDCDFIVMGMGEKTLEERLLGNTVIRAIHRIKNLS